MTRYIFSIVLIFSTLCFAGDFDPLSFMLQTRSPKISYQQTAAQETISTTVSYKNKSPKTGMLLSATVPGAGQLYNGSYIKAAVFLAAEVTGWALYVTQTSKGNDIEAEFHDYANTNWSEDEYWDWIHSHSDVADRNDIEALRDWEHDHFSHGLHREKDQQYYEMIGKYDQFNYAWDDSDIGLLDEGFTKDQRSAHRLYYEDRRDASNQAFKKATTGVTIVLFNHIISALEAGWSISKNNSKLNTSVYGDYLKYDQEAVPALTVRINW